MLYCCSFFRIQQLGSGPADISRILVFHCSHRDLVTNTVLGQFKKKKTTHSKYAKKTNPRGQNSPHTIFYVPTNDFYFTHNLFVSYFADVSILHTPRKFSSKNEKEQSPVKETLFNVPQLAGNYETVHY